MWDEEPDSLEALEEHSFECESSDDSSGLGLNSDIADGAEEGVFDEDATYVDYEG